MTNEDEYNILVSLFHNFCRAGEKLEKETDPHKARLLDIEYNNLLHALKMDRKTSSGSGEIWKVF